MLPSASHLHRIELVAQLRNRDALADLRRAPLTHQRRAENLPLADPLADAPGRDAPSPGELSLADDVGIIVHGCLGGLFRQDVEPCLGSQNRLPLPNPRGPNYSWGWKCRKDPQPCAAHQCDACGM